MVYIGTKHLVISQKPYRQSHFFGKKIVKVFSVDLTFVFGKMNCKCHANINAEVFVAVISNIFKYLFRYARNSIYVTMLNYILIKYLFPTTMYSYAICAIRTLDKVEAYS
jgi:hypothetical protein